MYLVYRLVVSPKVEVTAEEVAQEADQVEDLVLLALSLTAFADQNMDVSKINWQ